MMESLRTAANSLVLKIVFVIIIASFILTGLNNYLISGGSKYAVKVNGQEISRWQFENTFASERNRIQQLDIQFSKQVPEEDYMKFLRQEILDRLINNTLLSQYAKNLGLKSSNEQVKKAIFSTQAFKKNGKFDNARYNTIINQMGINADQYAQALRKQLIAQQLINGLLDTDFMLKGEIDELIALIFQKRIIREATIDINALAAKQQVSNEEVQAYYAQNKASFVTPEKFRVNYIKLDVADMSSSASEKEIQSYYDRHQDQFTQAQRKRYSIIQTKTKADAKAALKELKNGTDFFVVAKSKSIDIFSAKNGGDIGWLEEPVFPEELKNAGLKHKGQLSGVIKSSVGFLVVQLNDVQPEKVKPLVDVREDIVKKIKKKKALDAFLAIQKKMKNATKNNKKSLVILEKTAGIKAVETDWFDYNNLPSELNFKPVADAIFSKSLVKKNSFPGNNLNFISIDNNRAFVLRVVAHKPEGVKPLTLVQDQIMTVVRRNKAEQQAKVDAKKILLELKEAKGNDALKTAGINFSSAKTLSRTVLDPISQAAFSLSPPFKGKPSYGIASNMQGNIVLLALDEIKEGTIPEDQKKAITQLIARHKAQILFEALISNLRKKAKIKMGDISTHQNYAV